MGSLISSKMAAPAARVIQVLSFLNLPSVSVFWLFRCCLRDVVCDFSQLLG